MKKIDGFLLIWAKWAVSRYDNSLGFSPESTMHRIMTEGPTGAAIRGTFGPRSIPISEMADLVESAMIKLLKDHRNVLVLEYVGRGTRRQKAGDLGVSENTYNSRLRRAKERLASEVDSLKSGFQKRKYSQNRDIEAVLGRI